MSYSAFCVPDPLGGVRLALFFEGFEDTDDAQMFLRVLMAPYEDPQYYDESDTVH
tara:strand:- start:1109 stop:1273 length:165 start_codon:yes stop_codon:yes gene_type:complete